MCISGNNQGIPSNVVPNAGQSKQKKGKPVSKKGPMISQEEMERIRAERRAKRAKREELIARGIDPDSHKELRFIRRPMLALPGVIPESIGKLQLTIMTYNCLAQTLIRRKLFPDSGDALKWHIRSKVLLHELKHYNPDVACLQEVDHTQFEHFWKQEYDKCGYSCQFYRNPIKTHGIAILWKKHMFTMTDRMLINFDKELSGDIPPRTVTNNVGLILALKFSDEMLRSLRGAHDSDKPLRSGLLVGTSHLFWHPFGTYERTRQCYILLNKMKEFEHRVNVLQNHNDKNLRHWYPFFCGDFNSEPFDAPYLSMTSKPISFVGRARTVIECSTSFKFSKLREGCDSADDEEGGNIEKFGKDQPQTPVPESFAATPEQRELVSKMEDLHNSLDMRAISLYGLAYNRVHSENAGVDNDRGEPEVSNWANKWHGLLDYLFFISRWNFTDNTVAESLEDFERENSVRILELLRLPPKEEMIKLGHGQPHIGEYPSDHLCLMCKIEIDSHLP